MHLVQQLLRYRSNAALSHPTLHELLHPLYTRDDFDIERAVELLEAVNPEHVNESERDALAFELPKLREYEYAPIIKESVERLMRLQPPRHSGHRARYTYQHPLTAKLEHMAITQTLDRLHGTELGAMFYEQPSRRVKPKQVLPARVAAQPLCRCCAEAGVATRRADDG